MKLPESLRTLSYHAFSASGLKEIEIPAALTSCDRPFYNCRQLTSVTFAKDMKTIPNSVLADCTGLKTVTIPDGIETIGNYAFESCDTLMTVEIPESVTAIGSAAFSCCNALESVKLPEGLRTLSYHAFSASGLKEIEIPAALTSSDHPFYNCRQLTSATIAKGMKKIPAYLFADCPVLDSAAIPETVTAIGTCAFGNCSSLKSVKLPEGLEALGYHAFTDTGLKEIEIPAALTSSDHPFYGCKQLSSANIAKGMEKIPAYLFADCPGLRTVTIPATVTDIGTCAFGNCSSLTSVKLPEGLKTLGYHAFSGAGIKAIEIPASLAKADSPFYDCKKLETAVLAEGTSNVPDSLFSQAYGLRSVTLPKSIVSIGKRAFTDCKLLTEVSCPNKAPFFWNTSFWGCDSLMDNRFMMLDGENSSVSVNSVVGTANGLLNFTVKYKLTVKADFANVSLSYPEWLTILPESVTCSDPDMQIGRNYDTFSGKASEGTIRFSARLTSAKPATVTANIAFRYNSMDWNNRIGSVLVEAPALTLNAPETVSSLSAKVSGLTGKEQSVQILVNDELAETVTANKYTGKYTAAIKLPNLSDGGTCKIQAKTETAETEAVTVTYRKEAPVVESVWLVYNNHRNSRKDITDIFVSGTSPVISFLPSAPLQFIIKMSNSQAIDKLYVTSTKGSEVKAMEAKYDPEKDEWSTGDAFFETGRGAYVPGALNISVIEKKPDIVLNAEKDAELIEESSHLPESTPEALRNNTSAAVIEKTDHSVAADFTISNGEKDVDFTYYANRSDSVPLNGQNVPAKEIAKNPEKYGYTRSSMTYEDEQGVHVFYERILDQDEAMNLLSLSNVEEAIGAYENWASGVSSLEVIESDIVGHSVDDSVICSVMNEMISSKTVSFLDDCAGIGLGKHLTAVGVISDTLTYAERIANAQTEYEVLVSTLIYCGQFLVDTGAVEMGLAIAIGTGGFAPLIIAGSAAVIAVLIDGISDSYDDIISGSGTFSVGGFIRFLIDPSGIVYEAVLSNPVTGAEVTIYYLDPETGEQTIWNAEDYEQQNPLTTAEDGAYAWDVPEGKWKVVCKKDGYDTAESEWMDVPPVRTDVMMSMVDHSAPAIAETEVRENGLLVRFSKYVDITTVTEKSIVLKGITGYSVLPVLHEAEDAYTDEFLISGVIPAGKQTVGITAALKSYAGTAAVAAEQTVTLKEAIRRKGDLNGDNQLTVADAVLANRLLAEDSFKADASVWGAADVDSDGMVTVLDIRMLYKLLLSEET